MKYSIANDRFRLSADDMGAELAGFSQDGYEYIWQKNEVWNGQSPLLFPIVGRLREDTYEFKGKAYTLKKHGFARRMPFRPEKIGTDHMTFLLTDTPATREAYPFPFELRVEYRVEEDGFTMRHCVRNTGEEDMYFSIGAHPGFRCEMGDTLRLEGVRDAACYQLDADALRKEAVSPLTEDGVLTVTRHIFDHDAWIFDGVREGACAILTRGNGRNVRVDFGGAPCLGVWAKPGARYVCIEPWYGIDDKQNAPHELTRKERIERLAPHGEFRSAVRVTVERHIFALQSGQI